MHLLKFNMWFEHIHSVLIKVIYQPYAFNFFFKQKSNNVDRPSNACIAVEHVCVKYIVTAVLFVSQY